MMDEDKYRQDRAEYVEQYREACRSYDGAVLTLAAAAFGLSVTIVDRVGHSGIYVMVTAWVCFVTSIVSTIVSYFTSQEACDHRIEELDRDFVQRQEHDQSDCRKYRKKRNADRYRKQTIFLNRVSLVTFLAGLVFFSFFVVVNFVSPKEVAMPEKKDVGKIQESVNHKIVQQTDKRGFPTVRPAQTPPSPPPSSTGGESNKKKD